MVYHGFITTRIVSMFWCNVFGLSQKKNLLQKVEESIFYFLFSRIISIKKNIM
jgi:hypothetical protein